MPLVDVELAIIKKIVDTGDFDPLLKANIDQTFFRDPKCAAAFSLIHRTYHSQDTWGMVPSLRQLAPILPDLDSTAPTLETMPVLIRDLRNAFTCQQLSHISNSIGSYIVDGRAEEALEFLRHEVLKFEQKTLRTKDVEFKSNYQDIIENYDWVRNKNGLTGIPWPWDVLNNESMGIQNGEYIVFNARPKNMKTWVLCYLAYYAYQFARRRVLFYTREMAVETILRRMVAIAGGVDYSKFVKAQLTEAEELKLWRDLQTASDIENILDDRGSRAMLRVTDCSDPGLGPGISGLKKKIEATSPDIIFIDAVYLMHDERAAKNAAEWLRHTHVSRDVRDIARDTGIPIIVSTQVKREGEKTRGGSTQESAYTDAFGQDGSYIFRLNLDRGSEEIVVVVSGSREINLDGFVINAKPAYDFRQKSAHLPPSYRKQFGIPDPDDPNAPPDLRETQGGPPKKMGKKDMANAMLATTQDPVTPSPLIEKTAQQAIQALEKPKRRAKPRF
jgi:replicative DNA helicase